MVCSTEGGASLIAVWPFSVLHSITLIDKIAYMKFPHIKIEWTEPMKLPVTVSVRKLSNGYLIGDVYFATEDKLVVELAKWVKEPYANHDVPEYKD